MPSQAWAGQRNWRYGIPSPKLVFTLDKGQLFLSMGHSGIDVLMHALRVQCGKYLPSECGDLSLDPRNPCKADTMASVIAEPLRGDDG